MGAIALDPGTPPEQHLEQLRVMIEQGLVALLDLALGSDDPAEVARCLAAVRDFRQDVGTVYADVAPKHRAEYEALRIDERVHDNDGRSRWDIWDDGGLERPGGDEW